MRTLLNIALAALIVVLIGVAGVCVWFFLYTADLPDSGRLAQFAPAAPLVLTDRCLVGPVTAVPAEQMRALLRNAIKAAEPAGSVSLQISRSMFCDNLPQVERQFRVLRLDFTCAIASPAKSCLPSTLIERGSATEGTESTTHPSTTCTKTRST